MKLVVMIIAVLAGCAGASYQTIRLENKTSRPIEAVYVYPIGSANHGASQRALAPNEAGEIKVRAGHVEVMAVSAKVEIDRHTRDQPSVTQDLELNRPIKLVFYDAADDKPAGLEGADVIGVAFTLAKSNAPPPTSDDK